MGFPFATSLHALIEKIGHPIHGLSPSASPLIAEEHLLLWDCYLSGQMSDAALTREVKADPEFAVAVAVLERTLGRAAHKVHHPGDD